MPKNLQLQEFAAATTYGEINQSIRSINFAEFDRCTAVGETFAGHLQRLVKLYAAVRPLLTAVSALPLVPQSWRAGMALFLVTVDAITSSPEANPNFKAGKDILSRVCPGGGPN